MRVCLGFIGFRILGLRVLGCGFTGFIRFRAYRVYGVYRVYRVEGLRF